MNPARLIGGWLLLCGLSAAGAYFAIDEADRRYDLSQYDLRAKVGLSATPSPSPQPATPAPGPSSGSSQQPPTVTPPPQPQPQPTPQQPVTPPPQPQPTPAPTTPNPNPPVQPGGSKGIPAPRTTPPGGGQTTPAPVNPNPQPTTPPTNPNPQPQNPPTAPTPQPAKPTISTPDPRSTDEWRQLHDFYQQTSPQAEAVLRHMETMKYQTERVNRGVFRVDLQVAMAGLRDSMTNAKRALDSGDTDRARSFLTSAYQHLQTLEKARR